MPCNKVIFCSLSVAALASWTILLIDDVELRWSGVGGDETGSSVDAIASCAFGGAMLQKAKQLPGTERGTAAEENKGKVDRERETGPDGGANVDGRTGAGLAWNL